MQNVTESKAPVVLLLVTGREKKRSGSEKWYCARASNESRNKEL